MGVVAERVRLLIGQMRKELPNDYGWQTQVARKLGVSQPTVSRITSPSDPKDPDIATLETIVTKRRITPEFFFAPLPDGAHYTDFLRPKLVKPPDPPPELLRFLERVREVGAREPTGEERAWLQSLWWPSGPTEKAYWLALEALRTTQSLEHLSATERSDQGS